MVQDEMPAFISLISSDTLPSPGSHITAPKLPQLTLDHESEPGASDSLSSPKYDGGRQAWLSLFGGFCAMTGVFGYVNAFGVYQDRYVRENVTSASGASWIGSVQVFLLIGTGFFTGPLVDRGYFRIMFFSGSILYLFSLFMLSIADITRYYQLILAQGFGMGLGAGCIYIPTIVVQSHHWKKYRPVAIGLIFSGSSLGAIVFSTMLNQLLRTGTSFGWAVRASAFVVLALLAIANVCISPRKIQAIQHHSEEPVTSYKALFLDLPYMLANISAFLTILCTFYPYFYIELYAISHGVNSNIAFYMVAILNAASIPGRVLPSVCALRFGTFNVLIFCMLCFAATTFSLFRISSLSEITVYTILAGFFTGAIFSLLAAAVVKFARSHAEAGRRAGLSFAMGACGSLIGNPINGALLGSTLQWNKTFIFIGVMTLVATAFLTAARQIVVKNGSSQII